MHEATQQSTNPLKDLFISGDQKYITDNLDQNITFITVFCNKIIYSQFGKQKQKHTIFQ